MPALAQFRKAQSILLRLYIGKQTKPLGSILNYPHPQQQQQEILRAEMKFSLSSEISLKDKEAAV